VTRSCVIISGRLSFYLRQGFEFFLAAQQKPDVHEFVEFAGLGTVSPTKTF
jgi:hypothetical protein